VVAIVAILVGLLVPAVQRLRAAAARSESLNNLRQIGLACHAAADARKTLPVAWNAWWMHPPHNSGSYQGPWKTLRGDVVLHYALLPYLEQNNVYRPGAGEQVFSRAGDRRVWSIVLPVYLAPLDPSAPAGNVVTGVCYGWLEGGAGTPWATTSYAYNYQVFGRAGGNPWSWDHWGTHLGLDRIKDGTSNTLFFCEKMQVCRGIGSLWAHGGWNLDHAPAIGTVSWGTPQAGVTPEDCDRWRPHAFSEGGALACMADASARPVSPSVGYTTWRRLLDPDDGMPIGDL
jgi:hypothetical protein